MKDYALYPTLICTIINANFSIQTFLLILDELLFHWSIRGKLYIYLLYLLYFSDAIVNQVLDELGLQLGDQLSGLPSTAASVPGGTVKQPTPVAAGANGVSDADADLQARLDNLRRE